MAREIKIHNRLSILEQECLDGYEYYIKIPNQFRKIRIIKGSTRISESVLRLMVFFEVFQEEISQLNYKAERYKVISEDPKVSVREVCEYDQYTGEPFYKYYLMLDDTGKTELIHISHEGPLNILMQDDDDI